MSTLSAGFALFYMVFWQVFWFVHCMALVGYFSYSFYPGVVLFLCLLLVVVFSVLSCLYFVCWVAGCLVFVCIWCSIPWSFCRYM